MRLLILISFVGCVLAAPRETNPTARASRDLGVSGGFQQSFNPRSLNFGGLENSLDIPGQDLNSHTGISNLNIALQGQEFNPDNNVGLTSFGLRDQGHIAPNDVSVGIGHAVGIGSQGHIIPGSHSDVISNSLDFGNEIYSTRGLLSRESESNLGLLENQGYVPPGTTLGEFNNLAIGGNQGNVLQGELSNDFGFNQGYIAPETFTGGLSSNLEIGANQGYIAPETGTGGISSNLGISGNQGYIVPETFSGGLSSNLGTIGNQGYIVPETVSGGLSNNLGFGTLGYDGSGSFRNSLDILQHDYNAPERASKRPSSSTGLSNQAYAAPGKLSAGFENIRNYGRQCGPDKILHVDGSCVRPHVARNVFVYRAPKLPKPYIPRPQLPKPKVFYNVVFVRTPEKVPTPDPIVVPPPQQKTVVYVLTKNGHVGQKVIEIPAGPDQDPEVFYVNYNDGDNPLLPGGITLKEALSTAISQDGQLVGSYDSGIVSDIRVGDNRSYSSELGSAGIQKRISPSYGGGIQGGFSSPKHI